MLRYTWFSLIVVLAGCQSMVLTPSPSTPVKPSFHQIQQESDDGVIIVGGEGDSGQWGNAYVAPNPSQTPEQEPPANADMLYDMGRQFMEGDGVERNEEVAQGYLRDAAQLGHVEARRVLAILALRKDRNDSVALSELKDVAQVSVKAKAHYGMMLANLTEPKLNDVELGKQYLLQADELQSAEAAYALYLLNKPVDQKTAHLYLVKAADRGQAAAVKAMAHDTAYQGRSADSLHWIKAAMAQGDDQAMFDFANGLMIGRFQTTLSGVPNARDFEAYYWYSKAAEHGHKASIEELDHLSGVKVLMSRQQMTMATLDSLISAKNSDSTQ